MSKKEKKPPVWSQPASIKAALAIRELKKLKDQQKILAKKSALLQQIIIDETEAIDTVFSVDESVIYFSKQEMIRTAVIILGNDGYDCIADNSCSNPALADDDFEKIMDAVQEYADKFCE